MGTQIQYLTNLQFQNSKKWFFGDKMAIEIVILVQMHWNLQLFKAQKLKVNEYGLKMFPNYLFYQEKLSGGVLKTPPPPYD